jgi:hypothetical protein
MIRRDLPVACTRGDPDREAMMPPRPPLTPQEQRTIRDWSFAMAALYCMILLALFASAIYSVRPPSAADTAAAGMRQDAAGAISSERAPSPLTEASTQQ